MVSFLLNCGNSGTTPPKTNVNTMVPQLFSQNLVCENMKHDVKALLACWLQEMYSNDGVLCFNRTETSGSAVIL